MSQLEFADVIGRSESWVSKVETGVIRLDSLALAQSITELLGVPLSHLIALDARSGRGEVTPAPTKSSAERGSATSPPHGGRGGGGRYATGRVVSTSDQIGSLLLGENVKPDLMVELLFLSRSVQVRNLVLDL